MAFTLNTFQFNRGVTTCATNGSGVGTVIHGYKSSDTTGTIVTASYFPNNIDGSTDKVFVGDLLLIVSSNAVSIHEITSVAPFVIGSDLFGGTGSPFVIAPPVAATDANGIQISGTTVNLEVADATHAGIITEFDQTFAGIKNFLSGVKFMTFGGTPATLNYYERYTHVATFTNGAETTGNINVFVARIGNIVTVATDDVITTPAQGAPGTRFTANTVLPARFVPVNFANGFWRVSNGGVFKAGQIEIDGIGNISILNDANGTTAYTAAQISQATRGSITYLVP